jgi:hypothetical protein
MRSGSASTACAGYTRLESTSGPVMFSSVVHHLVWFSYNHGTSDKLRVCCCLQGASS